MDTRVSTANETSRDWRTPLVGILCAIGAAAGAYFLYRDLTLSGAKGQGAPLAKVERKEAKVKRKVASSYVWAPVQQNELLYKRDSIQTGLGSAASVRFNDGSVLEVGEESLIVIDDIQNLSLNFVRGSLVVRRASGDTRISAGKDGKVKVEELPVQLLEPARFANFFVPSGDTKKLVFQWKPRTSADSKPQSYTLQLSTEKTFRPQKTQSFKIEDANATQFAAQIPAGKYFWRITSDQAGPSETYSFKIASAVSLKPTFPIRDQRVPSFGEETPIQFRWTRPSASDSEVPGEHVIEIARDRGFKNVLVSEEISADNLAASFRRIPEGPVFWRIKSRYEEVALESAVESFTVEKAKRLPVALALPGDRSALEQQPQVRFIWSSEIPEAEYQLELQTANGSPLPGYQGKSSSFIWKGPAPNSYRWRVIAIRDKQIMGESTWRTFSIYAGQKLALLSPPQNQTYQFWENRPTFQFQWTSDSLATQPDFSYELEIAKDAAFTQKVASKLLKTNSIFSQEVPLAEGSHFWRVRVVDTSGQVAKTSETFRFHYAPFPALKAPEQAVSQTGETHNYMELRKDPVISWSRVNEATAYELSLYPSDPTGRAPASQSKPVLQKTLSGDALELKGLKEGTYFWTVRPVDRLNRRGEGTPPRKIIITYGEPLDAPEVTSSEVQ